MYCFDGSGGVPGLEADRGGDFVGVSTDPVGDASYLVLRREFLALGVESAAILDLSPIVLSFRLFFFTSGTAAGANIRSPLP